MRKKIMLLAGVVLYLGCCAAAPRPDAGAESLQLRPASTKPTIAGTQMLGITRAGHRIVAVGEGGTIALSDDDGISFRRAQAVPVLIYSGAITVMTVSTILAGFSRPFVWIGAMLFMISDSLIAAGRFRTPVPLAVYLIWPTYYLGQYGIAIGFLREKCGDTSPG